MSKSVYPPDPPPPPPDESSQVDLIYHGDSNAMSVRSVSGALEGIADAYSHVGAGNRVYFSSAGYGNSLRIRVSVDHSSQRDLHSDMFPDSALSPTELLFGDRGVLSLIRGFARRRIVSYEQTDSNVTAILDDSEAVNLPQALFGFVYGDILRRAVHRMLDPIDYKHAVDALEIVADQNVHRFEYADKQYFGAPIVESGDDRIERFRTLMEVVSPTFKEGNKWRVLIRGNSELVSIADEGFSAQVNRGRIGFAKGDILDGEVVVTDRGGRKPAYSVTRVYRHEHVEVQGELFGPQ